MSTYEIGTCGACIAFVVLSRDEDSAKGECRLRPELSTISDTLPRCPKYVERDTGATWTPKRAVHGRGSNRLDDEGVEAMRERREQKSRPSKPRVTRSPSTRVESRRVHTQSPPAYGASIDLGDGDEAMDTQALRALIRDVLHDEGVLGETETGARWDGGTLILKPGVEGQQSKEIPLEVFFKKIVSVRDKLRVLEQKMNGSTSLSEREKVDMQQYITRCYGSLTTFNILFDDKSDHFKGSSS